MSKQSEAKKEQNYREAPDSCANCGHYESQMVEKTCDAWNGKRVWSEEKGKRCTIGGFSVKKMATCDRHVLVTSNAEVSGCLRTPMPEDAPMTAAGSPLDRPVGPVAGA